jgi:hypothetical protein
MKLAADLEGMATIPLCWAASTQETEGYANLGDSLSAVIVAALANRPIRHVNFCDRVTKLVAVGTIGDQIRNGTAIIWGTGVSIAARVLLKNALCTSYDVRAMRGPISANEYREVGIQVPRVFGDPVWLLPSIIFKPVSKRYELGVIPHIGEVSGHHPDSPPHTEASCYTTDPADSTSVIVINTWHQPNWEGLLDKVRLIRSCKRIVSHSFHGVVIAEAFGIPVLTFDHQPGERHGFARKNLAAPCTTDPRIWDFYAGGRHQSFSVYTQPRNRCTDWENVIQEIDSRWEPFDYDADALVDAFPWPLAFDPLTTRASSLRHVESLNF